MIMNHIFQLEVSQNKRKNPERFFNTEMFMMMMMIRNKLFFFLRRRLRLLFLQNG